MKKQISIPLPRASPQVSAIDRNTPPGQSLYDKHLTGTLTLRNARQPCVGQRERHHVAPL